MGMNQADLVFPHQPEHVKGLADEEKGHQEPFQDVVLKVRDDATVIGEIFCKREEIAESVDQYTLYRLLSERAGVVGCEDDDPIFTRQSSAKEVYERGFSISLPARVG